jgi:hypothetical protein
MNRTGRFRTTLAAAIGAATLVAAAGASALEFNQDVTPDVIFGSGSANGGFTTDRANGVELGLRGKLRFNDANDPENTFNSNGAGTYTFEAGQPPGGGYSFAPNSPSTAKWNFEWSINSDWDGTSGFMLDDLTYSIQIDFDPGPGTNFLTFDPINLAFADHGIGNNSTGNGGGTVALNDASYASLIASNNVAQNSWNMEFFDSGTFPFNANVGGVYTFQLSASDSTGLLASTSIDIVAQAVPAPATLALIGLGLLGIAVPRRRRTK